MLVLLVGWLWWDSHRRWSFVAYGSPDESVVMAASDEGGLYLCKATGTRAYSGWSAAHIRHEYLDTNSFEYSYSATVQRWKPVRFLRTPQTAEWLWVVPHWFLMFLLGVWPVLRSWRWWRRRSRHRNGYCPTCGYDLRASSERCPECGNACRPNIARLRTELTTSNIERRTEVGRQ